MNLPAQGAWNGQKGVLGTGEIRLDAGTIGRRIDLRDELDTLDPSRHEGTPLASTSTWVIMAPASVSCAPDGEPVHLW